MATLWPYPIFNPIYSVDPGRNGFNNSVLWIHADHDVLCIPLHRVYWLLRLLLVCPEDLRRGQGRLGRLKMTLNLTSLPNTTQQHTDPPRPYEMTPLFVP